MSNSPLTFSAAQAEAKAAFDAYMADENNEVAKADVRANELWHHTYSDTLKAEAIAGSKDAYAAVKAAKAKADAASPESPYAKVAVDADVDADVARYYDRAWNETRRAALNAEVLAGSIDAFASTKANKKE